MGENDPDMAALTLLPLLPLVALAHLGQLHAYERALVLVIAFGPFVVLGFVVAVLRRRDVAQDRQEQQERREQEERDHRS